MRINSSLDRAKEQKEVVVSELDDLKKNEEKLRKYQKKLLLIIEEGEAAGDKFREAIRLARVQLGKIEHFLAAMNVGNN